MNGMNPANGDGDIPSGKLPPDHVWELHPEIPVVAPDPGREELLEFFSMVGGFGSRARRRYHQLVPERLRSRTGLVAISLAVSLAALAIQSSAKRPPSELPLELQGAWTTTHADYADRGFWVGKHQVAFRVGPHREDVNVYPVSHLAVDRTRGDTTWYTVTYAVDGGINNWSIRHVSLPHPAIVFLHQPAMTWTVKPDLNAPVK